MAHSPTFFQHPECWESNPGRTTEKMSQLGELTSETINFLPKVSSLLRMAGRGGDPGNEIELSKMHILMVSFQTKNTWNIWWWKSHAWLGFVF